MSQISSGIDDLDNLIDLLYAGDNVVWGTCPNFKLLTFNLIKEEEDESK
ncbi:MAG: hypothetical protein QMC83_02925 [Thermodesulfovibrionales bacterium]|nr:hypothetical protein [Thermodesulfovibrionales bacterium]